MSVGRADLADLAEVHDDDAVADVLHHREVVRDEDQREAVALLHVLEQVEDLRLHRHVERRHGLVADDQLRLGDDGARDRDALALATGELVRPAAALQRRDRARPRASSRRSSPAAPRRVPIFQMRRPSAMMSSTLRRGFSDEIGSWKIIFIRVRVRRSSSPESCAMSRPSNSTCPDVGARQLHDRLARGRLAAARLADEPERLALLHVEADVRNRVHLQAGAPDRELDERSAFLDLTDVDPTSRELLHASSSTGKKHAASWPGSTSCPFAPRCRFRQTRCDAELPLLREVDPGQEAACFFPVEEDAWSRSRLVGST